MPRIGRIVATGYPHHITQRGNNQQKIFFDENDRLMYLSLIREYADKYNVSMIAYCLMENHVHFIAIPNQEDSFSRIFRVAHMRYAQYLHNKINSSGHLWQGRFFSCILDDNHLLAAARYVERNPVRGRKVEKPCDWKWSSAMYHAGKRSLEIPLHDLFELIEVRKEDWEDFINAEDDNQFIKGIRNNTRTGRPVGSDNFIKKLEKKIGISLTAQAVGRPRLNK